MAGSPSRLLIVDDDQEICALITLYFQKHGFEVVDAHSASQMRRELGRESIDLVLLDIMLPDASGLDLCREIRQTTDIPVIMLTAVSDLADRVAGLEIGADDYVAKPFEPRELLARVRAVIRRRTQAHAPEPQHAGETYRLDGWTLDIDRRRFVSPDEVLISLTYAEFELLAILARNANRPLSRGHILELVSGIGSDVYDRSVDVLVSRLRRKLEGAGCMLAISSIRNVGYALQAQVERLMMAVLARFLPRSFAAWVLIIVISAVIAFQVVTLLVATYSVAGNLRTADLFRLAERISGVARAVSGQPPDERRALISSLQSAFLAVTVDNAPAVSDIIADDDEMAELEDILTAKLATNGVTDLRIAEYDTNKAAAGQGLMLHGESGDEGIEAALAREAQSFGKTGYFAASMKMADSDWINFIVRKSPATTPLTSGNLYIYALIAAVPLLICFWAVQQLVWPYRRLERAVHRLGEDFNAPEIAESGDYEVRSVVRAINTMQTRLKDHLSEREHLAAALAHDLRTPLTRMKIRCELSKSQTVQLIGQDIREIERIVNSVLEFSRAETASAPRDKVDLASLVQDVCDNFPEVTYRGPDAERGRGAIVRANTTFLVRAVTNLVENAVRHAGSARVSILAEEGWVSIRVEDDGKGIPPEELENVVKPFYRLESSRNKDTGGTGLGLAITDSVARNHGGRLELSNRAEGGLRASIVLPLG